MENTTKEHQFNLPPAAVFNLQQIALADDDMVKAPGAAEKYRFIARHILELFASSGSVAAPKHSTCSDIPLPLEPTECREIRPAITWEEIRNLHKENEEIKLFLEDIRRIAFNGFSYKDRILDIQKKFPSR